MKSGVYEQVIYLHYMKGSRRHWGYRKPQNILRSHRQGRERGMWKKNPKPSECSGVQLWEGCSPLSNWDLLFFIALKLKLLEEFLLLFTESFFNTETEELKKKINLTAAVLIDFISYLLWFSLLVLMSLSLVPSCQSWDGTFQWIPEIPGGDVVTVTELETPCDNYVWTSR